MRDVTRADGDIRQNSDYHTISVEHVRVVRDYIQVRNSTYLVLMFFDPDRTRRATNSETKVVGHNADTRIRQCICPFASYSP